MGSRIVVFPDNHLSKIVAHKQIFPSWLMTIITVFIFDCLPSIHFISLPHVYQPCDLGVNDSTPFPRTPE